MNLFPPQHEATNKGHGRIEKRRIWTSEDLRGYVNFPHARQVFRIERISTDLKGKDEKREICFGITSATKYRGTPARLLAYNRGHWKIENGVHYVRDEGLGEDRCRARRGHIAQALATIRNLVLNLLRRAGATNIAWAIRHCSRHMEKVLRLFGL